MKSLRVPPVWSHACSSTRWAGLAPSVYTTVPPTAVAFGSTAGYSAVGISPYTTPFTGGETGTGRPGTRAQPAPVSPAEAKNVRPSATACDRASPLASWAGPSRPSRAGLSSHRPSDAFTWLGPSGSLAHDWRVVA